MLFFGAHGALRRWEAVQLTTGLCASNHCRCSRLMTARTRTSRRTRSSGRFLAACRWESLVASASRPRPRTSSSRRSLAWRPRSSRRALSAPLPGASLHRPPRPALVPLVAARVSVARALTPVRRLALVAPGPCVHPPASAARPRPRRPCGQPLRRRSASSTGRTRNRLRQKFPQLYVLYLSLALCCTTLSLPAHSARTHCSGMHTPKQISLPRRNPVSRRCRTTTSSRSTRSPRPAPSDLAPLAPRARPAKWPSSPTWT